MKRLGLDATPLIGVQTGIGRYTNGLLSHLSQVETDWQVQALANKPLPPPYAASKIGRNFPLSRWTWMQTILPLTLQRAQLDLVHFPNSIAPLVCPTPYIVTIHDVSLFTHAWTHPQSRQLSMKWMLPTVARNAAHIITVSEFSKREIQSVLGVAADDISVVYEAAAPEFVPTTDVAQRAAVKRRYALADNFLLYVGTLEPRKNLLRLVRSFLKLQPDFPDWQLILVGALGHDAEALLALTAQHPAIRHIGYVPQAELPTLYSLATAFVFPSLYEGFGLPPLEAMACGTPVLTSDTSSLVELFSSAALLCTPTDCDSVTASLQALLSKPELRHTLAAKGQQLAANFSWQSATAQTIEIYNKINS